MQNVTFDREIKNVYKITSSLDSEPIKSKNIKIELPEEKCNSYLFLI